MCDQRACTVLGVGGVLDTRVWVDAGWATLGRVRHHGESWVAVDLAYLAAAGIDGGGVFAYEGNVTITNSTVSGNSSPQAGGGIYSRHGDVELIDIIDRDGKHLIGERAIARCGPNGDIAAGPVGFAVDRAGDGDDTGTRIDRKPSARIVIVPVCQCSRTRPVHNHNG